MANYRDVLTPSEAEEMSRFLRALTEGAEICKQAGMKPDILAAITAWRHVPMTAGEHAVTMGFKEREKQAKILRLNKAN